MNIKILEKMISDDDSISFEENMSLNIEISEMVKDLLDDVKIDGDNKLVSPLASADVL